MLASTNLAIGHIPSLVLSLFFTFTTCVDCCVPNVFVMMQCMHENFEKPTACEALVEDYMECLHHRKYVSVVRRHSKRQHLYTHCFPPAFHNSCKLYEVTSSPLLLPVLCSSRGSWLLQQRRRSRRRQPRRNQSTTEQSQVVQQQQPCMNQATTVPQSVCRHRRIASSAAHTAMWQFWRLQQHTQVGWVGNGMLMWC